MALLRTKEIRAMDAETIAKKLTELRDELMHERGVAAMGGAPPNPGKIRALRKNIARILTIESRGREARAGGRRDVMANLRKHELIGLRVEVVDASDPSQEHVRGRVVDETRNMLVVDVQGEEKRIPKHGSRFRFDVPGGFEVDGDEIRFRPEDRVKKAR